MPVSPKMPPWARRGFAPLLVCALIALMVAPAVARADFGFQLKWGTASTSLCTNGVPNDSPPGQPGKFAGPSSVAYHDGNVYVVDQNNNRVQKFDSEGQYDTMWGRNGGTCGSNGAASGEFNLPIGVATDADGNVYVADAGNNRIQKFSPNGTFLTRWGASGGNGASGTGPGQFSIPFGLGIDKLNDFVYVADTFNGRVQKFDLEGNYIDEFDVALPGDPDEARPVSVAVDSQGNLYIVDSNYARVTKFDDDFSFLLDWGSQGSGDGDFGDRLFNLAIDSRDHVFVADVDNNRVQEFESDGDFVTKFPASSGSGSGDGEFDEPTSVATDPFSGVYVTDWQNQRVQKFVNSAGAGTTDNEAGTNNTTLGFQAGEGVANDLTITLSGGTYTLIDVAPIDPTGTCTQGANAYTVECPASGVTDIEVTLADRDDKVVIDAPTPSTIDGGSEDDVLEGGSGSDSIDGGAGFNVASFAHAGSGITATLTGATGAGNDDLANIDGLYGSDHADSLTGDAQQNVIRGSGGDDTLDGAGETDTLDYGNAGGGVTVNLANSVQSTGGAGTDTLVGSSFENVTGSAHGDSLTGSGGDNVIVGGLGDDTLDGNGGDDTASYASASQAVQVDLSIATAQSTGGAGDDTLTDVDNLIGSPRADALTGNDSANRILGGVGSDLLEGQGGNDDIDGGNGVDRASYSNAPSAVTVGLSAGAQNTQGAGTDTLIAIENLTGSDGGDTLAGNAGANAINGSGGDDMVTGAGGNDTLTGGPGTDTAGYANASSAVVVDLRETGLQITGGGGIDALGQIENLIGSDHGDTLTGNNDVNDIEAGNGNDTIGVRDSTADHADCGPGTDTATVDTLDSTASCETISKEGGDGGGSGGTPPVIAPPPLDVTAPAVSGVKAVRVSSKTGGTLEFSLTEGATVKFTFEKSQLGRQTKAKKKKGKSRKKSTSACKKQTKRNRKGKVCRYYTPVGSVTTSGATGANAFKFDAKVGGKPLKSGPYRLTVVAVDAAGNASAPVTVIIPILR